MSRFSPATVRCRCGNDHPAEVAESLNISARPALRDAVLAGELHRFPCPACSRVNQVETVFAYTDFGRAQWFTVVPAASLARRDDWLRFAEDRFQDAFVRRAPPLVRGWAPRFTRRVVFGLASLREKLVAFDAGLDDRRLEQLKAELIEQHRLVYVPPDGYCHLARVTGDSLVFELGVPGDPSTQAAPVPRREYDAVDVADPTRRRQVLFDTPVVDMRVLFLPTGAHA
jgi:hypothetical protein